MEHAFEMVPYFTNTGPLKMTPFGIAILTGSLETSERVPKPNINLVISRPESDSLVTQVEIGGWLAGWLGEWLAGWPALGDDLSAHV